MKNTYQISTEPEIIKRLGISADDLTLYRYECGVKYLIETNGEQATDEIIRKKEFWNWYQKIWMINDRQILKMFEAMPDRLTLEEYINAQNIKAKRYSMNRSFINTKSIIKNGQTKDRSIVKIS